MTIIAANRPEQLAPHAKNGKSIRLENGESGKKDLYCLPTQTSSEDYVPGNKTTDQGRSGEKGLVKYISNIKARSKESQVPERFLTERASGPAWVNPEVQGRSLRR